MNLAGLCCRQTFQLVSIWRNVSTRNIQMQRMGVGGYALLGIPVITFCLGTWQIQRRSWKLGLISELEGKSLQPPTDLPEDLEALSEMEYRKVKVKGTFDHSKEMYVGPRSLVDKKSDKGGGVFSTGVQSGYHVITPFHLTDKEITILVNRGWVPKKQLSPQKRKEGQVEGEVELAGIVRLPEERPLFSPKTSHTGRNFYYRDVEEMARMSASAPVFIDADVQSTVDAGPIGGQTRLTIRNEHMSYIITWYSLSAATFWLWYKKCIPRAKVL